MLLYLVRHGHAHDRDHGKWPDDRGRPLTKKGESRMQRVAKVLSGMDLSIGRCLSSSLTRAWQTALILHEEADWPEAKKFAPLEPGHTPAEVVNGIAGYRDDAIALVGHEPSLSQLGGWLIAGANANAVFEMKKGGIACIDINGAPVAGRGRLLWLASPRFLLHGED
jgi:phosphohistidine phosphatase